MAKKRYNIYRANKHADIEGEVIDLEKGTTTKEPPPSYLKPEPIRCFVNSGDNEIRKSTVMTSTDVSQEKTIFSDSIINPNKRDGRNPFDTTSLITTIFKASEENSLAKKVAESPKYKQITKKELEKLSHRIAINIMADLGHEPITELVRVYNSVWEEIQYQRMVREGQKTYRAANGKPYNVRYNPESIPKLYSLLVDINVKLMKFGYKLPSEIPNEIAEIPRFELNLIKDNKMFRVTDEGAEIEINPSEEAISTAELERRLNGEADANENEDEEEEILKEYDEEVEEAPSDEEETPKSMKLFEKEV